MKSLSELTSASNKPRLIPTFKQPERKLLSIFMSLLEIVPEFRGAFLRRCGYGSGKICSYQSYMEPQYTSPKFPEVRPDGLVICQRGQSVWSSFIEAKAGKSKIRTEQMENYTDLASMLDIDCVISISNEFAKEPDELPYHLSVSKRKKRNLYHFSWAELRSFTALFHEGDNGCDETERALIGQCLDFFWDKNSGIITYDAMPQNWPKFVESAGTALGFSSKTQGVTEVVHGWQQERRDLCAKIIYETKEHVEIRHDAGLRVDAEQCLKFDRAQLADHYQLTTTYIFKNSKARLRILADLRSCKISTALEIFPPQNKKAKACVTWVGNAVIDSDLTNAKVSFDWKGRCLDITVLGSELISRHSEICTGQKDAPKRIRLIREFQDVRCFKSRTKFIETLENLTLNLVRDSMERGLI